LTHDFELACDLLFFCSKRYHFNRGRNEPRQECPPEGEERTSTIQEALLAMIDGTPLIVVDDKDRENEGDLIVAAEQVTAETVTFVVRWTSGVLCIALPSERRLELQLPLMVEEKTPIQCAPLSQCRSILERGLLPVSQRANARRQSERSLILCFRLTISPAADMSFHFVQFMKVF
jgi:hypothetical protein